MLLEMAVADAYAIHAEFTDVRTGPNDLSAYHPHPTYKELPAAKYTDDTQRSIAHVDVMLGHRSEDLFEMYAYADAYLKAYRRDPREGYSRGYQAFIDQCSTPEAFLSNIKRTKDSNGAVMGVAPLGYLRATEHVKQAAMVQAITTHHPSTVVHAQCVALSSHFFIHLGGKSHDLIEYLMETADWLGDEAYRWRYLVDSFNDMRKKTSIKASSISAYVAWAVTYYENLTEIMIDAVGRGGDTDSAAASAVAVASCCPGFENDLPQVLLDTLEPDNKDYGPEFLRNLDRKLLEKFA